MLRLNKREEKRCSPTKVIPGPRAAAASRLAPSFVMPGPVRGIHVLPSSCSAKKDVDGRDKARL